MSITSPYGSVGTPNSSDKLKKPLDKTKENLLPTHKEQRKSIILFGFRFVPTTKPILNKDYGILRSSPVVRDGILKKKWTFI